MIATYANRYRYFNQLTRVKGMLQDRWSSPEWRRIYFRLYKQKKRGKLGDHTDLVKLTDKLYDEEHPRQREKQVHPDLRILDERGRRNPHRETALYLRSLCRDEDKPQDFIEVHFNPKDASNPSEHHPIVNIRRRRKHVTELPSSDDW